MPYTAPTSPLPSPVYDSKLAGAYPTPPPSPFDLDVPPPVELGAHLFAQHLHAPSRAPSLPCLRAPPAAAPQRKRTLGRIPSFPLLGAHSRSTDLRLAEPQGILAVLGGVRVLRIDAASALDNDSDSDSNDDRMPAASARSAPAQRSTPTTSTSPSTSPYTTSYSAQTMGLVEAATTERVQSLRRPSLNDLRRAQSESNVPTVPPAPPSAPPLASTARTAAGQIPPSTSSLSQRASSTPAPIYVQPPSPTRIESSSPRIENQPPKTPPSLARSPSASPSRHPSSPSLGITVRDNVLPEVRSPRRSPEQLPNTRRSRRPRLFGFTGIDHPTQSGSVVSSPESIGNTMGAIPRRSNSTRGKDSSLHALGHASPAQPKEKKEPKEPIIHSRPRRDTGLKLDLKGIVPETVHDAPVSAGVISSYHTVLRKKSGEVVRSALKTPRQVTSNGSTPPATDRARLLLETRSCPTTPGCPKYVHFDSQLERVKLFLQDQKPQVVSRQGSPDFTDVDSEPEEEVEKVLQIKLPNFPTSHPLNADMYLESMFLSDSRDALRGVVVVRNFSFQKWVTVRFTFDWWQTTSEVSASYQDSIRGGTFDRFTFQVKLGDLLERLEEKTLFLCVRYNTDGRELWDSNDGQNYQVLFERTAKSLPRSKYLPKRSHKASGAGMGKNDRNAWSVRGSDADRMADLRAKLNRLTAEDRELNAPIPLSPHARFAASPRSSSPRTSPHKNRAVSSPATGSTEGSSKRRYDFTSALQSSRNLSPSVRTRDLPVSPAATEFYSPRPDFLHGVGPASPMGPPSPGIPSDSPSSPISPLPFVGNSSPLAGPPALHPLGSGNSSSTSSLSSVNSIMATPSDSPALLRSTAPTTAPAPAVKPAESPLPSPSPSSSDSSMSPRDMFPWSAKERDDDMSRASYSHFIEQFCWGGSTDASSSTAAVPAASPAKLPPSATFATSDADVRRVHSTSSLDHYFSSPPDLTPRVFTPTANLSRSTSANGGSTSSTSTPLQGKTTPPTREDLEHVDSAIRSLSSSLASTPVEGSPSLPATPMARIASGSTVMAA